MRIRDFCKNIEADLKPYELKNCDVVIDGQNYLYRMYEKSGLPFQFGCEGDNYAQYLRQRLSIFKKANVKCYFIFKGGHSDIQRKMEKDKTCPVDYIVESNTYHANEMNPFVLPIFMKEIYKEVLGEINLNYVICEFESKTQCIALAQELDCPLISFDIEFIFSGVTYIPCSYSGDSLRYDATTGSIHCSKLSFDDFEQKHELTPTKIATFIVLTDEHIKDVEDWSQKFYEFIKLQRKSAFHRNLYLLKWISRTKYETIIKYLQKCLRPEEYDTFTREINKIMKVIRRKETPEIPVKYLMQENRLEFEVKDPLWFQKGVACGYVPLQYVNMFHWNIVNGSWCIEDPEAEDAMLLSLDIIKYAYNLLTNFERRELQFYDNKNELTIVKVADAAAVPKTTYTAVQSPFENGWANIWSLRLFENFLENSMPAYNFNRFDDLPEEARLLMIALVYFSQKKSVGTNVEVCSVLLSYVLLGVVADKCDKNDCDDIVLVPKPILDSITDKELVTESDSAAAKASLKEYFIVSPSDVETIDRQMLHPLVQLQHCLQQLNFLNKLCGSPYAPTKYSRTYNGTFVYKVAQTVTDAYGGNVEDFVEKLLSPAPTVLAFFNGLKEAYEAVRVLYR